MNLLQKFVIVCGLCVTCLPSIVARADNTHVVQTDSTSLLNQIEDTRKKLMETYETFNKIMISVGLIDKRDGPGKVFAALSGRVINQVENTISIANGPIWKNEIQPGLNKSLQDLVNYNSAFHSLCDKMIQAHSAKDLKQVLQLLKQLQDDFTKKQEPITTGLKKITDYQTGVMDNTSKLNDLLQEVQTIIRTKAATEEDLIQTQRLENPLVKFIEELSKESGWEKSVQNLSNNWSILNTKIDSLITKIETAPNQVDSVYLRSELNSIKNAWSDTYAQAMRIL
ncbi:HBL/NHE enterotoxin family protein [Bacillus thuringiensis]|uniref:HBL/NHE enterotoxin family protein n=1 Tax=Bacillus thuringiensis TaxID=1428 RepID=UPI0011A6B634|nr:HBL/NHE enterotoxin family protein [Bacillus thuringiensis]